MDRYDSDRWALLFIATALILTLLGLGSWALVALPLAVIGLGAERRIRATEREKLLTELEQQGLRPRTRLACDHHPSTLNDDTGLFECKCGRSTLSPRRDP